LKDGRNAEVLKKVTQAVQDGEDQGVSGHLRQGGDKGDNPRRLEADRGHRYKS
jgi:hypothetical protein